MVNYDISFKYTKCTISNLKLIKDENFELPRQPDNITVLIIKDSTIPTLTEDLIGAFANLEVLDAHESGIEEVSENAFAGCKNLRKIILKNNKIKALQPNTFNRNTKLEKLSLNDNQLDFLPKELFLNLENLNLLSISYNNLTSLSKKLFTNQKLETLYVNGNLLTNVKVDEIIKQCPKLRWFGIYDNDFSRGVLENIQKCLKDAGVNYHCLVFGTLRSRPYATQKLDKVEYIPDEEYERLLVRNKNIKLKKIANSNQQIEKLWQKKFGLMEEKLELMQQRIENLELTLQELRLEKSTI